MTSKPDSAQQWDLEKISLSHRFSNFNEFGTHEAEGNDELVRMHFGLQGAYDFTYKQLNSSYSLQGSHNNLMYSKGISLEVQNKSNQLETFGVNFDPVFFLQICETGPDRLKRFCEKVLKQENAILSQNWRPNTVRIEQVIREITQCQFTPELKNLFLISKSIELLVLQAELYEKSTDPYPMDVSEKRKLFEAKEILAQRLTDPPTINELSRLIGLNEFKLKKGFKAIFGTTIFGFIHQSRMQLAKNLLLGTMKSAKEIAYEAGYGSPQHFSNAFKKEFGYPPNHIRKNPDLTIDPE